MPNQIRNQNMNADGYTINPLTHRKVKKLGKVWQKLSTLFFTDRENNFLDQRIPSGEYFDMWDGQNLSARSWNRVQDISRERHPQKKRRMTINPLTNKRVVVGSPAWKEVNQYYNWNGEQFTTVRQESRAKKIDRQLENAEILDNKLGYKVVYIHTSKGDMHSANRGEKKKYRKFKYEKDRQGYKVSMLDGSNTQRVDTKYCRVTDGDRSVIQEVCNKIVDYLKKGETDVPQYLISLSTYDLFSVPNNSEDKAMMFLTDKRPGNKRVMTKGREKEWCMEFLLHEYQNLIEDLQMKGSGWVYAGNMGFEIVMIPLKVFVGAAIKTPTIIGETVVNACIDDNRCFQRSLINACDPSYDKHRHVCDANRYNKYWNKPNKNLIFNHTIHEIEAAVNIQDNKPFVADPVNFEIIEHLLNIYITCYQFNMQSGFDIKSNTDENAELFTFNPIYPLITKDEDAFRDNKPHIYLCVLNDVEKELKHFTYIKDHERLLTNIQFISTNRNRNGSLKKDRKICCRWCPYINCHSIVLKHECKCHPEMVPEEEKYILESCPDKRMQFVHQRYHICSPYVGYADFESSIDQEKKHKPIMLSTTFVSRDPKMLDCHKTFYGPHEDPKDFVPYIEFLMNIRRKIDALHFNAENLIVTEEIEKDYEDAEVCPFCGVPVLNKEDYDIVSAICKTEKYRHIVDLEEFYNEDPELLNNQEIKELERAQMNGELDKAHRYLEENGTMNTHGLSSKEWRTTRESYHTNKSRWIQLSKKCYAHKLTNEERDEYEKLKNTTLRYARQKVRHHAHFAGEYFNGNETRQYAAGEYICTCCSKCNLQMGFSKKTYKLPVFFHNGSRYDNAFLMKIIHEYRLKYPKSKLDVIPTATDKEMLITLDGLVFKDSYKLIPDSLKKIVDQNLGKDINNYPYTRKNLRWWFISHKKHWDDSYIELLTRKEPMFYGLITSYYSLSIKKMPKQCECFDDLSHKYMSDEDYNHMKLLWTTFDIKNWGEYYEMYNLLDTTLLADAFESQRNSTLKEFGVDCVHYLTAPQMTYDMFLKITMNADTSRYDQLGDKWSQYMMKIGENRVSVASKQTLSEAQLKQIYIDRMNTFIADGGIRIPSKGDKDVFLKVHDNLRGGITQITKRYAYAPVDPNNKQYKPDTRLFYLDANNLYGGTMMRMMPYDLTKGSLKSEWNLINKHGPTAWVNSLGTYDQYGYLIECDINLDKKFYDKFNDLPFFPTHRTGEYSPAMKQKAKESGVEDMIKENKTKKLICDLCPKHHYFVHYSMLQLALQQGYTLTKIHHIYKFKQAPFIFEYVNHLSEMRAQASSAVLKNLFKLFANSIYGKFVETGDNRIKVKFASTLKERNKIMMKYNEMIDGMDLYDDLWVGKIYSPVKRMTKPFFIGFAILDMSKYIIYDFYYNKLKETFNDVGLLGQDTDSLMVEITDPNLDEKLLDMYKSFDLSELDPSSYYYKKVVEYYNSDKVNKSQESHSDSKESLRDSFPTLQSFLNYNKKVAGPIFKDEHKGHRIEEFCGLRPKLYCICDETHTIHNAAKGVPRTVTDEDGKIIKYKTMGSYKTVLFGTTRNEAVLTGTFNRIANRDLEIETKQQTKVLFTCLDNKRYVCEDGVHTLAFRE